MADTTPTTIASTVASLPGSAAERFGSHSAARFKTDGEWRELSYAEMGEAIDEIALGLVDLGIEVGDRVCILAETRLEWTLASLGASAAGAVAVPVYPTNAPSECKWVAGNSGARAIFCENEGQRAKIEEVRDELPDLEHVIGIDEGGGELSLDELRARGRERDRGELGPRQEQVSPEDPYTIVYTSGTTGAPKGVVLTHANAMAVCQMVEELEFVEPGDVSYLYLPLAHVFALITMLATVDEGTTLIYFGGNTREILAEIIETKPTYVPSVPRIFEKLYAAALKLQAQASEEDQARFAHDVGQGLLLVPGVVAQRDAVGARGEDLVGRVFGDAEAGGGVLAVDHHEVEPEPPAQARSLSRSRARHALHRRSAGCPRPSGSNARHPATLKAGWALASAVGSPSSPGCWPMEPDNHARRC